MQAMWNVRSGLNVAALNCRDARHAGLIENYTIYNYFAFPPALSAFCDEALAVSRDAKLVQRGGLDTFTATALPRMEGVFENFYSAYEQYRVDVAAWDAKYGADSGSAN